MILSLTQPNAFTHPGNDTFPLFFCSLFSKEASGFLIEKERERARRIEDCVVVRVSGGKMAGKTNVSI